MAKEFITKDNLNNIFSKATPTRADILQGGGGKDDKTVTFLIIGLSVNNQLWRSL